MGHYQEQIERRAEGQNKYFNLGLKIKAAKTEKEKAEIRRQRAQIVKAYMLNI